MLRTLTAGIAIIAVAVFAGAAMAGDYHYSTNLICADCHTMHYSLQHDYVGGAPPTLGAGGPHEALLKAEPNDLCKSCHDGKDFAPDTVGDNTGTHTREAGGLTTGAAPREDYKGHTLGSMDAPPGNGGLYVASTHGLECVNCHHQHGGGAPGAPVGYLKGQWRNLRNKPGSSATDTPLMCAVGTNDTTLPIFERSDALGDIPNHYAIGNVDFNEPDETKSHYAAWCKGCHTDFHGAKGGTEVGGNPADNWEWHRHPNADVNIGAQSGHGHSKISSGFNKPGKANWVKTMDPAGQWAYNTSTDAAPGSFTPSCFSCHKAHGNQNAFGLIYMAGTGTVSEEGDSNGTGARDLCRQCHSQGAVPV